METLRQDLRYAVRSLLKSPGFTAVAVLTLALGIGATTALFTTIDALLLQPLPVHEPDRLVEIDAVRSFGGGTFSYPEYEALNERSRTFAGIAAVQSVQLNFGDEAYAEEISGRFVSANYFRVLGIRPALGRFFAPGDDRPGASTTGVVLSHRLWERRFGAAPSVVGQTVEINGYRTTVIGVAPEEFTGTTVNRLPELWAPLALHEQVVPNSRTYSPMSFSLSLIGRLGPGVSPERVRVEMDPLADQVQEAVAGPLELEGIELRKLSRIPASYEGSLLRFVAMLTAATGLVLLIASVNVAGMLLVRALARQREIAIRAAMGAGRGRLVRQMLTEGVLLWMLGGAGGLLLALWLTDLLLAFRWPVPVMLDLGLDLRVLAFALLLSLGTGVLFSLIPALRASRPDLVPALKGTGRNRRHGGIRLRGAFVVGQVAMSLLLLVAAGLFLRALQHALSIDPGFNPDQVMVTQIDLHRQRYEEPHGRLLYQEILERARQVPGIETASLSAAVPLGPGSEMLQVEPVGAADSERDFIHANIVGSEYFQTMEIPLFRGQAFTDADRADAPTVAVINETMAARFWPGENPVGKRFTQVFSAMQMMMGGDQEPAKYEVAGVVPDIKTGALREDPEAHIYLPLSQNYRSSLVLAIRTRGDAGQAAAAVRRQIHALDPNLPLVDLTPLNHLIGDELLAQRIGAILTSLFGLLGLVLAAVGVYGVMAFAVSQQTREIGIRIALGARSGSVLRLVLGKSLVLTLIGVGVGLAAAYAATRFLSSLLYGVSATDPLTFVAVSLLLFGVALLAAYLPARRATRVDPMVALRAE